MFSHRFFRIFIVVFFISSCGGGDESVSDETVNETTVNEATDTIAFLQIDSGDLFQMDKYGENVFPLDERSHTSKKWENQLQILNTACSKGAPKVTSVINGLEQFETPISVFSPDGAFLGLLENTSWEPVWSPNGEQVAFACGVDENHNVVVVSNYEYSGSSEGWSRSGKATVSDSIEIFVSNIPGNRIVQLTYNESGDWLPRWFPKIAFDPFDKSQSIGFLPDDGGYIGFSDPILIETNRANKSEILVLSTTSTQSWPISDNYSNAQSPVWSKKGNYAAFTRGEQDGFEIVTVSKLFGKDPFETDQPGIPVP